MTNRELNVEAPAIKAIRARLAAGDGAGQRLAAHPFIKRQSDELLARLDLVKITPTTVVALDVDVSGISHRLSRRYPRAMVLACSSWQPRARPRGLSRLIAGARRANGCVASAESFPLADQSADLICANMVFACYSLARVSAELKRVLRPGGLLMFSMPGPQTLVEIRDAWLSIGAGDNRVHRFADVAEIGTVLSNDGFHDIVIDIDRERVAVGSAQELIRDLRSIGLRNARTDRPRGLTGRQLWSQFTAALADQLSVDGNRPGMSAEVVFGHAWAPRRAGVAVTLA